MIIYYSYKFPFKKFSFCDHVFCYNAFGSADSTLFRLGGKQVRLKKLPSSSFVYNAFTQLLMKTCLNIYLFFGPTPASLGDCNMSYKPFMEDLKNCT